MKIDEFDKLRDYEKNNALESIGIIYWVKRAIISLFIIVLASLGGCPMYNVWEQGLKGEAELARAEQNRQILINEAKAKSDSAKHWANAEIERAKGAAEANNIVAESLGGSEGYLRWLFIEKLDEIKEGQIIYLPTEAGMPILEAGRHIK